MGISFDDFVAFAAFLVVYEQVSVAIFKPPYEWLLAFIEGKVSQAIYDLLFKAQKWVYNLPLAVIVILAEFDLFALAGVDLGAIGVYITAAVSVQGAATIHGIWEALTGAR